MVVLDRKPHSEEEREQRERLQVDTYHQKRVQCAVKPAAIDPVTQELLENRDAKLGDEVDRQHTKQRGTAYRIDCPDACA